MARKAAPQSEIRFVEPMYAAPVRELPDGKKWIYEAKLDGYRCLAGKDKGGVTLWSRRGNLFTKRFHTVALACDKLPPDTLVDGEVVAVVEGRPSFNALQHARPNAELQFYAFDLLIHRGRSLIDEALEKRRDLLQQALSKVDPPVIFSANFNAPPADTRGQRERIGGHRRQAKRIAL
jgi:ATP-dependent DNA ligase